MVRTGAGFDAREQLIHVLRSLFLPLLHTDKPINEKEL
jgi:hypothetical protein